jgi:hypothetical protein
LPGEPPRAAFGVRPARWGSRTVPRARKREQAPRTPNASRGLLAARLRSALAAEKKGSSLNMIRFVSQAGCGPVCKRMLSLLEVPRWTRLAMALIEKGVSRRRRAAIASLAGSLLCCRFATCRVPIRARASTFPGGRSVRTVSRLQTCDTAD